MPLKKAIEEIAQSINLLLYIFKPHTRNSEFFERRDILESLKDVLLLSTDQTGPKALPTMKTFFVCGAEDLRKTQLAMKFVLVNKSCFDVILVLQASNTEKLAQSFAEIFVALDLKNADSAGDQTVSKNLVLS